MKLLPRILIILGISFIFFSLLLFIYIFAPVAKVEISYKLNKPNKTISQITPVSTSFGIVIPKIGANAKIIDNVDPFNASIYQKALTKGVAKAKGTANPNIANSNMFLFSHSSVNILEASQFNSVFYLLNKLSKNDDIYIYFEGKKYSYKITETKIVDAKDISYLSSKLEARSSKHTLTLMTCWPPGTSYKRLIVIATAK